MILVIDDDADDFDLLAEAIQTVSPSADLKYFQDAEDCLNEIQTMEVEPSIILLDINMPKRDGFTFLKQFRENKPLSKFPLLLCQLASLKNIRKVCHSGCSKVHIQTEFMARLVRRCKNHS